MIQIIVFVIHRIRRNSNLNISHLLEQTDCKLVEASPTSSIDCMHAHIIVDRMMKSAFSGAHFLSLPDKYKIECLY